MTPPEVEYEVLEVMYRNRLVQAREEYQQQAWGKARLALAEAEALLSGLQAMAQKSAEREAVAAPKSGTGTPPEPWEPHPFQSYPGREQECWICNHEEAWPKHINGRSKEASP